VKIVIKDEEINQYISGNRLECEFVDLPKMRAAIFKLSLQLDDEVIQFKDKPDTWVAKETKRLFDETLTEHYGIEEVKK
jgi:hypothetical protein